MQEILSAVDAELFGVWFLIGAALVFWMRGRFCNGRNRIHKSKEFR